MRHARCSPTSVRGSRPGSGFSSRTGASEAAVAMRVCDSDSPRDSQSVGAVLSCVLAGSVTVDVTDALSDCSKRGRPSTRTVVIPVLLKLLLSSLLRGGCFGRGSAGAVVAMLCQLSW